MTVHHFSADDARGLHFGGPAPRIVKTPCPAPFCRNGTVEVRDIRSGIAGIELCGICHGTGQQLVEARDE